MKYLSDQSKGRDVPYTAHQLDQARQVARSRNGPKVASRVTSNKWDSSRGEEETHFLGILGELAFSVYSGLPLRGSLGLRGETGSGIVGDFMLPSGHTVEVKYRSKPWQEFALENDNPDSFRASLGVLVHPSLKPGILRIHSCIRRHVFLANSTREKMKGWKLRVPLSAMETMDLIDSLLMNGDHNDGSTSSARDGVSELDRD